jgi:hypothetical protein
MEEVGDEVDLLSRRIEESGLSARRFAVDVLLRDERTIRRWLAGDSPIPKVVIGFLADPVASPWPGLRIDDWITTQSERWLRAVYRGDFHEVLPAIDSRYLEGWLSGFSIREDLKDRTLRKLSQVRGCLDNKDVQGAAAAILAVRRDWNCGPTNPPTFEDRIPTRLRNVSTKVAG